jgi:transcription elongation factor Elf1
MTGKSSKATAGAKKPESREITFLCRRCEKHKPISEMVTVTRFIPALIVCQECARELR